MSLILRRVAGCVLSIVMVLAGVSVSFPQDPLDVDIEIYYDGVWNDITQYVYHRDAAPIQITRGRPNESGQCDPGKLTLELNNRDGRFSPRNPNSSLFGKIGRNTPIRVQVTFGAVTYTRFVGEIASWPPRWDVSGTDVWIPIEAWGILKRLGQGEKPIRPPLVAYTLQSSPVDYWPMDDEDTATALHNAVPGGQSMTTRGTVNFSGAIGPDGSGSTVTFETSSYVRGHIRPFTDTGAWTVGGVVWIDDSAGSISSLNEVWFTGSSGIDFVTGYIDQTTDLLTIAKVFGSTFTIVATASTAAYADSILGSWVYVQTVGTNDASDTIAYRIHFMHDGALTTVTASGNLGAGLYQPPVQAIVGWPQSQRFGHMMVHASDMLSLGPTFVEAMNGWPGEQAHERFERVCAQENIPYQVTGEQSQQMSPQRVGTLLQTLRDAEATDQTLLGERRDALGLKFRTNSSRYHQIPIELDYTAGHISPPFDPEPDDQNVANDREVQSRAGGKARRELTSGPLSTQDPPDGVGRYDDTVTVDAYDDSELPHIASWRLHVGTWDAERYPRVRVDLSAASNTSLIPQIAAADSGDLITIDNLPEWLPPEQAQLLIEGYEETIGFFTWEFVFNCSPAGPYNVLGVWELMSHELHTAMNTAVTSADIANTDTDQPMLATSGLGSGYGVTINGERLQITAVADSLITFGAAGAASSGSSGSRATNLPAGAASGNLIIIFASTRNSGTGVPDTPADWDRLAIFPAAANCQVFARIYDGVWSMPTVTFTGGSANEDTIAQSFSLPGKWHDPANILIGAASCLNASAQNITYPGLSTPAADNSIILFFGWKQDDYTSVASPGTEIQEASSAAGNDASQVCAYTIQTTTAAVASSVFTVTGGASAISRGAVAAVRCDYQTATVTRSVNGVSASHSAGDAVTAYQPLRWALI